ncbi:hypothetical protein C8J95_1115 [Elizabethkingia sp. YR214]|uniref:hypothetical protein n=1 Tax=Elizabethkingia sp. YR214 TaxID=2135667 RepID=UPI000D3051F1|nr:hypothetical protein [Elizabethkingia sp. YR214]PUB26322.1 hypothetical protein C8J95_1115 [Elizabethkingia sp. YR214]
MPDDTSAYIKKEIWEKEQKAIDDHKKRFKLFTDLIPTEYRKEITRLTIFYPEQGSDVYAYMGDRKENSLSQFSLGLSYNPKPVKSNKVNTLVMIIPPIL